MYQKWNNSQVLPAGRQGEIAITFTVVSLVLMVAGTVLGLGVNKSQDVRTQASGGMCGKVCSATDGCGTDTTTGTVTSCDYTSTPHRCKPVRQPNNPPCNNPELFPVCNGACARAEDCNATDPTTGIALTCDLRSHTCQQKYVNDPRQCPGYISPTPRTGTGNGSGSDGSFKSSSLRCGVGFRVVVDPLINSITLSGSGGTYQVGKADLVKPDGTGFNGPTDPISYRMWQPASSDPSDNLLIEWDPANTYTDGAPKGALHVRVKSGNPVNEHSKINPQIDFYYFNNVPAWLKNGSPVTVTFKYYVLSGQQSKQTRNDYTIQATSQSCPGIPVTAGPSITRPPSATPTQTGTPTPPKKRCNDECLSDAECGYSLGGAKLICRAPAGETIKRCLLSKSDSPVCYTASPTPTRTPTPSPTRTPTPTRGITPSPTPTVVACKTTIDFMIDASHTTQEKLQPYQQAITNAVRSYGADPAHKNDNISFYTSYFAKTISTRSGPYSASSFTFPIKLGLNWTNIKGALDKLNQILGQSKGKAVFISDGLPSVIDHGRGEKGICVYGNGSQMRGKSSHKADGCSPDEASNTIRVPNVSQCSAECNSESYADAYSQSLVTTNRTNTYGVFVNTGAYANSELVDQVSQEVIDISELSGKIGEIFDKACGRVSSQTRAPAPTRQPDSGNQVHSVMSSFTIANQSTSKTIESVTVKACNASGSNCQDFQKPVNVGPGGTARFSYAISGDIPAENRAIVTCDVNYTDGTSLSCPQKATNDDGVQFALSISDQEVTGDAVSFLQASDINHDGVINGIDYVICANQIGNTGQKSCDIIADDLVNAQDISIVVERLGQRVQ